MTQDVWPTRLATNGASRPFGSANWGFRGGCLGTAGAAGAAGTAGTAGTAVARLVRCHGVPAPSPGLGVRPHFCVHSWPRVPAQNPVSKITTDVASAGSGTLVQDVPCWGFVVTPDTASQTFGQKCHA